MKWNHQDYRSKVFFSTTVKTVIDDSFSIKDTYITNTVSANSPQIYEPAAQRFITLNDLNRKSITVGGIKFEIIANLSSDQIPEFKTTEDKKAWLSSVTALPPTPPPTPTRFPTSPTGPVNPFTRCECPRLTLESIPYRMFDSTDPESDQCGWTEADIWCNGYITRTVTVACCKEPSPAFGEGACDPLDPRESVDIISEQDNIEDDWDDLQEIVSPIQPSTGNTERHTVQVAVNHSRNCQEFYTRFRDESGRNCVRITTYCRYCTTSLHLKFSPGCGNSIPNTPGIINPANTSTTVLGTL